MAQWEVIVGNIGKVWSGTNGFIANRTYGLYIRHSKNGDGRAAGEPVTLFRDNEIRKEYTGTIKEN